MFRCSVYPHLKENRESRRKNLSPNPPLRKKGKKADREKRKPQPCDHFVDSRLFVFTLTPPMGILLPSHIATVSGRLKLDSCKGVLQTPTTAVRSGRTRRLASQFAEKCRSGLKRFAERRTRIPREILLSGLKSVCSVSLFCNPVSTPVLTSERISADKFIRKLFFPRDSRAFPIPCSTARSAARPARC